MTSTKVPNNLLLGYPWTAADISGGVGMALPLEEHLTFSPDGVYDIGTNGAFRPRDSYLARNLFVGGVVVNRIKAGVPTDSDVVNPTDGMLIGNTANNLLHLRANGVWVALGAQGPAGPQGIKGDTGNTGAVGPPGPQGNPGPTTAWKGNWVGTTTYVANDAVAFGGSSFMATANVPLGTVPPADPWALIAQRGDPGPAGATGPAGAQGVPGPQGATGAQGPPGLTGPQGPPGVTGAQGPAGAEGAVGPVGPQGVAGAAGPQGSPGSPGPQGVEGPAGPAGAQGPAGLGLNIKGSVPTFPQLPPQPQPANDAYSVDSNGHLWTSNGTQWVDTGLLRGPQGPPGVAGAQGPTGATGPQGVPGATGQQGVQGVTGAQGPEGPQGPPGDPFGTPTLAIGVIIHWRPPRNTFDRYGLCKPAIVTEVVNLPAGEVNAVVLGSQGSPVLLYDHIPTGVVEGQWHFISDCPYAMGLTSTLTRTFATLVGAAT